MIKVKNIIEYLCFFGIMLYRVEEYKEGLWKVLN